MSPPRPPVSPGQVTALVPCHREPPSCALLDALRAEVGRLLIVDDGMPPEAARLLEARAAALGCEVLRLPRNLGKGHALAAGFAEILGRAPPPAAVLVVDGDGQHPPGSVPSFLRASSDAELVVGDRFGDLASMPLDRLVANLSASALLRLTTGVRVRDSQCGMRLLRGRALSEISFPPGGFEAETRHLVRCLRAGVRVAWVPIPAHYGDEVSAFRPLRDSARVVAAAFGRAGASAGSARTGGSPTPSPSCGRSHATSSALGRVPVRRREGAHPQSAGPAVRQAGEQLVGPVGEPVAGAELGVEARERPAAGR